MKLLSQKFEKNGEGTVGLQAEDDEDLWHLYNIVVPGDTLRTSTLRKVQKENVSGSGASQKMKLKLTIRIKTIDFDPLVGELRFSGINVSESDHVKMHAHHTSEVRKDQPVTVGKKCWDEIYIRRITEACDPSQRADLAAVVMQEGLAHVCLITGTMTVLKQKVEQPIPRKRRTGATQHDKSLLRFFDTVMQAIMRHIRWDVVKCFIVCSPGFVREDFQKYVFAEIVKRDQQKEAKELMQNRSKWVLAPCSSGYMHAIKEVISDPAVRIKLADTKAAGEVRIQEEFLDLLKDDEDRVVYGRLPVFAALEKGAIRKLLVLDTVFRPQDLGARKRWVKLVEDVEDQSGEVFFFSSMHMSGEWLQSLGGVAAILSYPCPELADIDSDEDEAAEREAREAREAEAQEAADAAPGFVDCGDDEFL